MIVTIAGSTFSFQPNNDELTGINLEFSAFDGQVGNGQFPIPDPSVALAGVTGTQFKVVQDFALLTDGFIIDQDRARGPFKVGSQREYAFSVQDANALLDGFRIFRHRGVETDVARVLAFAAIDLPGVDTTWVLNVNTASMAAKLYDSDGGWTSELIPDTLDLTGKTTFIHDKAAGGRCLHYHNLTSGHTCGLSISDVATTQNGVTVFAPQDPVRQRTSIDLRNDIVARDQANRSASATDSTSITAHDADGIRHQALLSLQANSQSDLQAQTNAYLASYKNDLDTWTCSIGPLDGTALGRIRVGDLITVTSGVMGLSASAQRIAHMRLKVADGPAPGLWTAELELGAPIRRRARVRNKAITDRIQHLPVEGFGGGDYCADVPETVVTDNTEYHAAATVFIDALSVTMVPDNPLPTVTNAAILSDPTNGIVGNFPAGFMGGADVSLRGPAAAGQQVVVTIPISLPKWTATDETSPSGIGSPLTPDWGLTIYADQSDPDAPYITVRINGRVDHPAQTVQIQLHGTIGGVTGGSSTFRTIPAMASADVPCTMTLTLDYDTGTTYLSFVPDSGGTPNALSYPVIPSTPMTSRVEGFAVMSGTYFTTGGTNANPPNVDSLSYSIITGTITWCLTGAGPTAYHGQWYGPIELGIADGSTSAFTMPAYPGNGLFVGHVLGFVNGQAQPVTVTDTSPPGTIDFGTDPADGDEIDATWLVP